MKHFFVIFGLIASLCLSTGGFAAQDLGKPPESVANSLKEARRMGSGTYKWFGVSIYDAQLWSALPAEKFDYGRDASWLELKYARNFKGADIAKKSREEMEKMQVGSDAQLKAWEKTLTSLFPDIRAGETLGAFYTPGQGIQFFKNDKALARLEDDTLSKAFMGIWLDPKTSAPALRKQLVGLP